MKTRDEFLQVQNGHWSPETAEAALAVDVAQAAYDEAGERLSRARARYDYLVGRENAQNDEPERSAARGWAA